MKFRDSGIIDKLDQWTPAWNATFGGDKYIFAMSPVWMPQYVIGPNDKKDDRWALMVPPGGGFIRGGSSHGIPKGQKTLSLPGNGSNSHHVSRRSGSAETDGVFTHFKKAYEDQIVHELDVKKFQQPGYGESFFVDIPATTKDMPENINDLALDDVMNICFRRWPKTNGLALSKRWRGFKRN